MNELNKMTILTHILFRFRKTLMENVTKFGNENSIIIIVKPRKLSDSRDSVPGCRHDGSPNTSFS